MNESVYSKVRGLLFWIGTPFQIYKGDKGLTTSLMGCRGHDVFNALDILENKSFLKQLKFGVGDGKLRYYLYNWRLKAELDSSDIGLVLL